MNKIQVLVAIIIILCCGCEREDEHYNYISHEERLRIYEYEQEKRKIREAIDREYEENEKCEISERLWYRDNSPPLKRGEIIWSVRYILYYPSIFESDYVHQNASEGPFWFEQRIDDGVIIAVNGIGQKYKLHDSNVDWKRRYEDLKF